KYDIQYLNCTGVHTFALPISLRWPRKDRCSIAMWILTASLLHTNGMSQPLCGGPTATAGRPSSRISSARESSVLRSVSNTPSTRDRKSVVQRKKGACVAYGDI